MCCHDWGAQHGIGFVNDEAYKNDTSEFNKVKNKIDSNKKGFELLKEAQLPNNFNEPNHTVQSLEEIWSGKELNAVRKYHHENKVDDLEVCKNCTFKDTYSWEKIN